MPVWFSNVWIQLQHLMNLIHVYQPNNFRASLASSIAIAKDFGMFFNKFV